MADRKPYSNPEVESTIVKMEDRFDSAFVAIEIWLKGELANLERDKSIVIANQVNVARTKSLLESLQSSLRNIGFGDLLQSEINDLFDMTNEILSQGEKEGMDPEYTKTTGQDVEALLFGAQRAIISCENEVAGTLEQLLIRSVLGDMTWTNLAGAVTDTLDISLAKAKIKMTDVINSFHTIVRTNYYIDNGVEWFLYDGPQDERTRPFCSAFVGSKVTKELLDRYSLDYDRNSPYPASISLGGYNCRHELIPLTNKEAIDQYPEGPLE